MQATARQESVRCTICHHMVRVVRAEGGARRLAFHTRRRDSSSACTGSGMPAETEAVAVKSRPTHREHLRWEELTEPEQGEVRAQFEGVFTEGWQARVFFTLWTDGKWSASATRPQVMP